MLLKAEQICKAAEVSPLQSETWARAARQVALVKRGSGTSVSSATGPMSQEDDLNFEGRVLCAETLMVLRHAACCGMTKTHFNILDVKLCRVVRKADWIINAKVADQAVFSKVSMGSKTYLPHFSGQA